MKALTIESHDPAIVTIEGRRYDAYIYKIDGEPKFVVLIKSEIEFVANFFAYEIDAIETTGRFLYKKDGWVALPEDMTHKIEEAETIIGGFVKWDGCCEMSISDFHICSADELFDITHMMRTVYVQCEMAIEKTQ